MYWCGKKIKRLFLFNMFITLNMLTCDPISGQDTSTESTCADKLLNHLSDNSGCDTTSLNSVSVRHEYSKDGELSSITMVEDNEVVYYVYIDRGHVVMSFYDFHSIPQRKSFTARNQGYIDCMFNKSCSYISYYDSGIVKSKGTLIYMEGSQPEVDSIEYGDWYYYDENGLLLKSCYYD